MSVAIVVAVFSLLSESEYNSWWIRLWDFPRTAIAVLALLLAVVAASFLRGWIRPVTVVLLLAVIGYQLWRIGPYTPFVDIEVARVDPADVGERNCFEAMSFNVYQNNVRFEEVREMVGRERPDILLLLETDRRWLREMGPVLDGYDRVEAMPLDNTYGMIFATNLDMRDGAFQELVEPGTPSFFATLETVAGRPFRVIALHPRPPQPGADTEPRDAEIAIAARIASKQKLPVLAMGDFNDVAWSKTSRMFKRVGNYLDPRIGRGFYATFPAGLPIFRWPLDHYFFSEDFLLAEIDVGDAIGSDHLPIAATLCLDSEGGEVLNQEPDRKTAEDMEDSAEAIEEGKEAVREKAEDEREEAMEERADALKARQDAD